MTSSGKCGHHGIDIDLRATDFPPGVIYKANTHV